jgi:hypothetical protein
MKNFIIIIALLNFLLLTSCAFAPVNRPNINKYSSDFSTTKTFNIPVEDLTSAAKSAIEAIGYEIQSSTPELNSFRTKVRAVIVPDICDCGTWNMRHVTGIADSSVIITVKPSKYGNTVDIVHYCAANFTGRNLWGLPTSKDAYQCASKGVVENEFWRTLEIILDARIK